LDKHSTYVGEGLGVLSALRAALVRTVLVGAVVALLAALLIGAARLGLVGLPILLGLAFALAIVLTVALVFLLTALLPARVLGLIGLAVLLTLLILLTLFILLIAVGLIGHDQAPSGPVASSRADSRTVRELASEAQQAVGLICLQLQGQSIGKTGVRLGVPDAQFGIIGNWLSGRELR